MKIVATRNFPEQTEVEDYLVCSDVASEREGHIMIKALNAAENAESIYFYDLVPSEYVLYTKGIPSEPTNTNQH